MRFMHTGSYFHTYPLIPDSHLATSTPPILDLVPHPVCSYLHTQSRYPRSHVLTLGESLVGLKMLPWKQGRFEEAVEVAMLSVNVN